MFWPPRSFCFSCGRVLPWFENIPVLSYLLLRGRCRGCGAPIGRRTLWLEAATPLWLAAWHEAARMLAWPLWQALWGAAGLSWLLLAVLILAERRRPGPVFPALGGLLALAPLLRLWEAAA